MRTGHDAGSVLDIRRGRLGREILIEPLLPLLAAARNAGSAADRVHDLGDAGRVREFGNRVAEAAGTLRGLDVVRKIRERTPRADNGAHKSGVFKVGAGALDDTHVRVSWSGRRDFPAA